MLFFFSCSSQEKDIANVDVVPIEKKKKQPKKFPINNFFNSHKEVEFVLIDNESKQPFKSTKCELHRVIEFFVDGPFKTKFLKKVVIDEKGTFRLTEEYLKKHENLFLKINSNYFSVQIGYSKEFNSIGYRRKSLFGSTVETVIYDFNTSLKHITNHSTLDTVVYEFKNIELNVEAFDTINYHWKIMNHIKANEDEFENNQVVMWNYIWQKFELGVEGDTLSSSNFNFWSGISLRFVDNMAKLKFRADLDVLKEYIANAKSPSKKYYFLYLTNWVASSHKKKGMKVDQKLFKWLKNEIEMWYGENTENELFKDVKKSTGDKLKKSYHFYSDWSP